ncbi:MAG: beta-ketoacyl synthase N-terminal-like domain-containing protein, partial [bacterium]
MKPAEERAVAIVGMGAIMPDAPDVEVFWENIKTGRYSISEVPRDRWDPDLYYDPDPKAPDKSYTKIGGWVREWAWDPLGWRFPIPPKVADAMDLTQRWAVSAARAALLDYGFPGRELDRERTGVIIANAMGGDTHLYTAARVLFPEFAEELKNTPDFVSLEPALRERILEQLAEGVDGRFPEITEDTMPGELANIIAGRIAALWDFRGPNYVADAACASTMAAMSAAVEGLVEGHYDAVVTGGVDANMGPPTFVKFCKIGALTATGSRPYAAGADGFAMGEGAGIFILKRLADAERDGDRIYALIRGFGESSDGRGKGITAPNPAGQRMAVRRAWEHLGLSPTPGDLLEGHGTSTKAGDAAEGESLHQVLSRFGLPSRSVPLGSVKSNIGHLKGAAGAAGILKMALALDEKVLPPSINFESPNPNIDFETAPFYVNTELRPWEKGPSGVRRGGVSAFGFGGTNFHVVMEEYVPGRIASERTVITASSERPPPGAAGEDPGIKPPLRGALVIGDEDEGRVVARLAGVLSEARAGWSPQPAPPFESDLRAPLRVAIDYGDAEELAERSERALEAFEKGDEAVWKLLRSRGVFKGSGPAPKTAFLFTGQGSQYANMLRELKEREPMVEEVFDEADRVMAPLLGQPLTEYIFVDGDDEEAAAQAEEDLKQTAITQPAVLAAETALKKLFEAWGIVPDMVMGHSLGEYGALVAADALPFADALEAVSARGKEMTKTSLEDNGKMAAVFGPVDEIQSVLDGVDGYVVVANINSTREAVIGGESPAVEKAMEDLSAAGYRTIQIPVSHAFHTKIVMGASEPLKKVLERLDLSPPQIPVIANITGDFYPMGPDAVPRMIEILGRQIGSTVRFVKGLRTLYDAGARVFMELGPKRALYGFAEDVLGGNGDVLPLFTNHPRIGDVESVNMALCGLYASGLGIGRPEEAEVPADVSAPKAPADVSAPKTSGGGVDRYEALGRLFAEFMDRGFETYYGSRAGGERPRIGITGASLGLPGVERVFDDRNVERILSGEVFIEPIPDELREGMADKGINRLVKGAGGEARFETIDDVAEVIKLAARRHDLDIVRDYGYPSDRIEALDVTTQLAIAAGVDVLRDAGIPLVMRYKTTTTGSRLPDRWILPAEMRDDTGIIFTSAFPGYNELIRILDEFREDRVRRARLEELASLREDLDPGSRAVSDLDRRIGELEEEVEENAFQFDRKFLFQVLAFAHAQFAEHIGARGPNTQMNGACSSASQGVSTAKDWIENGRCRRVIVISADDITSDTMLPWFGSGFLASGAAATDERVEDAATPFDRRRHGLLMGMGGAAVVLETLGAAAERGIQPITELMETKAANSAFHGSRLDVEHICEIMEDLVSTAETRWDLDRREMAPHLVFVSHETYTPARGGSASAEVFALRRVFGEHADDIVIANTKGYTAHPMGVGIEETVTVKMLETGIVPEVPNFKEVDPELGMLNLSTGGSYPIRYALRLGAGFGSQVTMSLMRHIPHPDGRRRAPSELGYAYRIVDPKAWEEFLRRSTGYEEPKVEVVSRTLRIKDEGPTNGGISVRPAAAPKPAPLPEPLAGPGPASAPTAQPAPVPGPSGGGEPAAPAAPPTDTLAEDPVARRVLEIISEKTGYPLDMLDTDLDLEADLGIDTVKQAEMFAAVREEWDIPREDDLA